jgi:hypothetical protein
LQKVARVGSGAPLRGIARLSGKPWPCTSTRIYYASMSQLLLQRTAPLTLDDDIIFYAPQATNCQPSILT